MPRLGAIAFFHQRQRMLHPRHHVARLHELLNALAEDLEAQGSLQNSIKHEVKAKIELSEAFPRKGTIA